MKLIVGLKDHKMIEFSGVQNIIYGNEEITYMQNSKIFVIKNVATFTIDEEDEDNV